jgi:hypothetical protein
VTVSNSPFLRPAYFAMNAFAGSLAPGWEVEAYQAGRLIAFDSTDAFGRYAIPLPTQYGENPVDFVAYGPFGEVREFNRTYRVANELLPAGRFEYGASLGACSVGRCTGTANVDLRYGITSRWTARAGYDDFHRDTLPRLFQPYLGITGSPTDALGIHLEGVTRALARGLVRYEPSTSLRLTGEYTRFTAGASDPVLTPSGWRSQWVLSGLVRPMGVRGSAYLEADATRTTTATGAVTHARLTTSVQRWDTRIAPYLRVERNDAGASGASARRSFVGVNAFILPRMRWGGVLGPAWVRTTLEIERSAGISEASVAITRPFARGVRVELGGKWTPTSAAATLVTSLDLAAVRSYTTAIVPRSGAPTTGQYLQGSLVVNTATREVRLAPGPSLQRSGVMGRVFLDANANGLFDPGEPLLPNVSLHVGGSAAKSDSAGLFEVWNVPPLEPAFVTVDSLSLPSPLWIPGFATLNVVPGPNRFVFIDVPIVPGGVVEGRVLLETRGGGRQPVGNAQLTLLDDRTGTRQVVTTFADGEFTAVAVRPGSYQVSVDQELLARLGVTVDVVRFVVPANPDGASVKAVDVLLTPSPPLEDRDR